MSLPSAQQVLRVYAVSPMTQLTPVLQPLCGWRASEPLCILPHHLSLWFAILPFFVFLLLTPFLSPSLLFSFLQLETLSSKYKLVQSIGHWGLCWKQCWEAPTVLHLTLYPPQPASFWGPQGPRYSAQSSTTQAPAGDHSILTIPDGTNELWNQFHESQPTMHYF